MKVNRRGLMKLLAGAMPAICSSELFGIGRASRILGAPGAGSPNPLHPVEQRNVSLPEPIHASAMGGFTNAANFGFSPNASGIDNMRALQRAVDQTGTVVVSRPGIYKLAGTVNIGSNTSLLFGNDVFVKKVAEQGPFTHVLLNKGALTRTWDHHIRVSGLQLIVNGVDALVWKVYGLRGQIAFFYAKDIEIDNFRCLDLGRIQYAIQVCTFRDLLIDNVIIEGGKDGIHLGRGKRFTLRNGAFETGDDAIALNGHDYATGNPELGWIEDGVVENMRDKPNPQQRVGYFCRILAGAWVNWYPGMKVQQSDTVVSDGRLYRVQEKPDNTIYTSVTRPTFPSGSRVLDGIDWGMIQNDVTYTAGVRNVVFRDISLGKPRAAFSVHFDNDRYSRSYYPGAPIPLQEDILIDDARVLYNEPTAFLGVATPVNIVTISNCTLRNNHIEFRANSALTDYEPTWINMIGCIFSARGPLRLLINKVANKRILFRTSSSAELSNAFSASIVPGTGKISVDSDLPGLRKSGA